MSARGQAIHSESLARQVDFFSFLGLPRKLTVDLADLDERYRALSRQFHPDYFYNAPAAERRASLERSSYLNDAYRTLRNPAARVEYLLGLEGLGSKSPGEAAEAADAGEAARHVPPALLEEVFALNEELAEIRERRASGEAGDEWKRRVERARAPIQAKRAAHERQLEELSARWDALVDTGASGGERRAVLEALRERVLERNYIKNLLAAIEREISAS